MYAVQIMLFPATEDLLPGSDLTGVEKEKAQPLSL